MLKRNLKRKTKINALSNLSLDKAFIYIFSFKQITPEEVANLIANEALVVIYVGRETCSYCGKFVKKLSHVAAQIDTPIYYVLSSEALYDFREQYDIVTRK